MLCLHLRGTDKAVFPAVPANDFEIGGGKKCGRLPIVIFTLGLRNPGSAPLDIAAQEIHAFGLTVGLPGTHRDRYPPEWDLRPAYYFKHTRLLLSTGLLRQGSAGGLPGRHIFLQKDESDEITETVVTRRGDFAAVEFDYTLVPYAGLSDKPNIRITLTRQSNGLYQIGKSSAGEDDGVLIVPL